MGCGQWRIRKQGQCRRQGVNLSIANINVNRAHNQAIQGLQPGRISGNWRMYSCAMDFSLKEWDVERQDCLSTFTSDSKIFTSLHFNESSRIVGTSHNDGRFVCGTYVRTTLKIPV